MSVRACSCAHTHTHLHIERLSKLSAAICVIKVNVVAESCTLLSGSTTNVANETGIKHLAKTSLR